MHRLTQRTQRLLTHIVFQYEKVTHTLVLITHPAPCATLCVKCHLALGERESWFEALLLDIFEQDLRGIAPASALLSPATPQFNFHPASAVVSLLSSPVCLHTHHHTLGSRHPAEAPGGAHRR